MADAAAVMERAFELCETYAEKSIEQALTEDEAMCYNSLCNMIKTWARWNELRHAEDIPGLEKKVAKAIAEDSEINPEEPDPKVTGEDDEGEHVNT